MAGSMAAGTLKSNGGVPCARWRQVDDGHLITNMQQLENAALVHRCTQFSQPYTLAEIEERWRVLMYNPKESKNALEDIHEFAQLGDRHAKTETIPFDRDEQLLLTRLDASLPDRTAHIPSELDSRTRGSGLTAGGGDLDTSDTHRASITSDTYDTTNPPTTTLPQPHTQMPSQEDGTPYTQEHSITHTGSDADKGTLFLQALQNLLQDNRTIFHPTRTVAQLEQHVEDLRLSGMWEALIKSDGTRGRNHGNKRISAGAGAVDGSGSAAATDASAAETNKVVSGKRRQKDRIKDTDTFKSGSATGATLSASESLTNVHVQALEGNEGGVVSFEDYERVVVNALQFGRRKIEALPQKDACSVPQCGAVESKTTESPETSRKKNQAKRQFAEAFPPGVEMELSMTDRYNKHKLRLLEKMTDPWQWTALNDAKIHATTKLRMFGAESKSLAHLYGDKLDHHIASKVVYFGRQNCDVNLAFEGRSLKISRLQGAIKLKSNLRFYLYNYGKRVIYVNGVAVNKGERTVLNHMALIEIFESKLLFSVNMALLSDISHDVINAIVSQNDAKK